MHRTISVSTLILTAALLAPLTMRAEQRSGAAAEAARAQATPPAAPAPAAPAQAARSRGPLLDIQIVIARSQDGKSISRLPYALAVTANAVAESQLNMGSDVPVPSTTFTPAPAKGDAGDKPAAPQPGPLMSYSYRSVGTVISCRASSGEDGTFEVTISVDDTSVFTQTAAQGSLMPGTMPVFRSFKARNTQLLLRDGQTRRFTAAADRVSGETVEVEVTLRVAK